MKINERKVNIIVRFYYFNSRAYESIRFRLHIPAKWLRARARRTLRDESNATNKQKHSKSNTNNNKMIL